MNKKASLKIKLFSAHLSYWIAAGFIINYFAAYIVGDQLKLWFVLLLLPVSAATTYFFTRHLIPKYLIQRRYGWFALYSLYTVILSVYMEIILLFLVFIFIADFNMHLAGFDASFFLTIMYLPVVGGIAIKLYSSYKQADKKNLLLLQQKAEAELKFLKSQLYPHFLFNTLNNLYAQTLEKSDKAPETVLQLSELLSYILYEGNQSHVKLSREMDQLNNYIELEKLRYENRVKISFDFQPAIADIEVIPLLLLPLLENAFKHGVKPDPGQSEIKLSIFKKDQKLNIICRNTVPQKSMQQKVGGIGLENLKRRLELAYGVNYKLDVDLNSGYFTVSISLWENKIK